MGDHLFARCSVPSVQRLALRKFMVLETRKKTSICIHVLACLVWDLTVCVLFFVEFVQFRLW